MNLYAMLASGHGDSTSSALAVRLAAWHDAMVAHERRLRAGRAGDVCDDHCPHVEARTLWAEASAAFGDRAHELSFLRSRATSITRLAPASVHPWSTDSERADMDQRTGRERQGPAGAPGHRPINRPSMRSRRITAEAEL
jgi:hypothetical protein